MTQRPTRLGKYEIERVIGRGGMAEVVLARLAGADNFVREVVIKRILPELAREQEFIDMFRDEAHITGQLRHGNIVQVLEFGHDANEYYLVLEYVDGASVAAILKAMRAQNRRLQPTVVAFILSEVGRALDYAHRKRDAEGKPLGVIHRDVSPSNIVVSRDGEVKLTDFGIARAEERLSSTRGRGIKGKLAYMAPEMIDSRPEPRSDFFSLGAVAWEMCVGYSPFEADTVSARVGRIISERPPPVYRLVPDVPKIVSDLIERLLEKDAAARPVRASEIVDALAPVLGTPIGSSASEVLAEVVRQTCESGMNRPSSIPTQTSGNKGQRPRALIVERSATARALLRSAMGTDLDVIEVDDAETALRVLADGAVVLVLSQQQLPGPISGVDLCSQLRANPRHAGVPFILVVAQTSPELIESGRAAGVTQVVEKTDPPTLARQLRTYVNAVLQRDQTT